MYSNSGLPLCRHVKANGERCGAPALRGKFYCYFHYRMRACDIRLAATSTLSTPRQGGGHPHDFTIGLPFPPEQPGVPALRLPLLEDANAVQCAIQLVLQSIVMGVLDPRRASLLLYGLQIASSNLEKTRFKPWPTDLASNPDPFTERTSPKPPPTTKATTLHQVMKARTLKTSTPILNRPLPPPTQPPTAPSRNSGSSST